MSRLPLAAALLLLAPLARPAPADILAPGSKWIGHDLVLDNIQEFPDHRFFTVTTFNEGIFPVAPDGAISRGNGNPINSVLFVAIPADRLEELGGKPLPEWFAGYSRMGRDESKKSAAPEGVEILATDLPHQRAAPIIDPVAKVVTHFQFVKDGDTLKLQEARTDRLGADGKPVGAAPAVGARGAALDRAAGPTTGALLWLTVVPALAVVALLVRLVTRRPSADARAA